MLTGSNQVTAFPTKRVIKRMGYSNDQDGIMHRYINEGGKWNEHLSNSKKFISDIIESSNSRSIAILGSGWLLDVPIEILMNRCEVIYLYDIRHPRPVVNKYKNYSGIKFIEMDITGGCIQYVYNCIKAKDYKGLSNLPSFQFSPVEEVDLLVSLNLLNQLDILIVEYLRRFPKVSAEVILDIRKQIQLAHLNSLITDKSCLISDYEELLFDRTGSLVGNNSLILNPLPKGKISREWVWEFDNRMTYYPNRLTHFKVRAIQL